MLHKTRGIFLQKINYSETSLIAKVYTEAFGLQSYLVKGARSKKSRFKANMLQHLALLDMEVYHRDNANLQKVKELSILEPFKELPYQVKKGTIALFINELLIKALKEEGSAPGLFNFLYNALIYLDQTQERIKSFHLIFMIRLSSYLGFNPQGDFSMKTPFFDLMEGVFVAHQPAHTYFLEKEIAEKLSLIKKLDVEESPVQQLSSAEQRILLLKLIDFYKLHLPGMSDLKSVAVLQSVLA